MGSISIISEPEVRRVVGLGAIELETIEAAFPLVSQGAGSMPPVMRIDVPEHNGEIDIKAAYLPGYPGIAVKVSAGFFDNPKKGIPSLGGLMVVLDTETGLPRAALFDNGYLTDLRTALAGAIAARYLAKLDSLSVAIFGAGLQARLQLAALGLVRPVTSARVWARRADEARRFAAEMADRLGIVVEACETRESALAEVDILVTATPAVDPLVHASMLHPGLHITAIGSDAEHKQELATDVVAAADVFAVDRRSQSIRLGELRAAVAAGLDVDGAVELGEIISGTHPGRSGDAEITVCDLTGTGAQDTAIAGLAVQRCVDAGLGTTIET